MYLLFIEEILGDSNTNTSNKLLQDDKAGCLLPTVMCPGKQRKYMEESAIHSLPPKGCMLWVNTGVAPAMNYRAGTHRELESQ